MPIYDNVFVEALRNLPLGEVLLHLGAVPDPKDPHNWRTSQGRITVTGPKFYNHDTCCGGGGAIDLVKHLNGGTFQEAVSTLSAFSGNVLQGPYVPTSPPTSPAANSFKTPTSPPIPVEQNWPTVRDYLSRVRGLDGSLLDRLHAQGTIYADASKNAVFLNEKRTGAELRGTGPLPFHGYRGEKAPFRLEGTLHEIAFVESAIDALSLCQMEFEGTILSFAGAAKGVIEEHGRISQQRGLTIYGAFDNDSAGETFFSILQTVAPRAVRIRPHGGKDLNDELLASKKKYLEESQQANH